MAKKSTLKPTDIIIKSLLKKLKELDYGNGEIFELFKDEIKSKVARSRAKKRVYDLLDGELKKVEPKLKRDRFQGF